MQHIYTIHILLLFLLTGIALPVFGQVDQPAQDPQDTVYLYEEEIVYDTLYVYDSIAPEKMMTKAELLKALCADRGVGTLKYQRHHFYISTEDSLIKLNGDDLKILLSPGDYADYKKAKQNQWASTPLWVVGSLATATSALGIYELASSYYYRFHSSGMTNQLSEEALKKMDKIGYAMFAIGLGVSIATFKPAAHIVNRSEDTLNRLARRFKSGTNYSYVAPTCKVGSTPYGLGLTLDF